MNIGKLIRAIGVGLGIVSAPPVLGILPEKIAGVVVAGAYVFGHLLEAFGVGQSQK